MSTIEAPREQEQIIGTVTGIVQKGPDKWQAVVSPDGSQYTKNLWTKDQQVVAWLSSQIGNRIAFLCNVSHWTNQQNQPVRSLWIDQVGPPTVGSPAMAGPPQQGTTYYPQQHGDSAVPATMVHPPQAMGQQVVVQPQVQPLGQPMPAATYDDDPKQDKIHRQTASKVAAILLQNLPAEERNMSTLLVLSERLKAYYDHGVTQAETVEDLMNRAMPSGMEHPSEQGATMNPDSVPYTGDDDIPF